MTTSLTRRFALTAAAVGLSLSLAACGAMGPSGSGADSTSGSTAAPVTQAPTTPDTTGDAADCANVSTTLATIQERLAGLQQKVPGDLSGAISDIQTSIDELTQLSNSLQDGPVKLHVDNIIRYGNEAIDILSRMQSGELSTLEGISQGSAKLVEVNDEITALNAYCQQA